MLVLVVHVVAFPFGFRKREKPRVQLVDLDLGVCSRRPLFVLRGGRDGKRLFSSVLAISIFCLFFVRRCKHAYCASAWVGGQLGRCGFHRTRLGLKCSWAFGGDFFCLFSCSMFWVWIWHVAFVLPVFVSFLPAP